ncbi:uncharacterized protein L201_001300 [Kwoniella dendrophila CBS 6074]|uniref:Zn(2)-C6 fungal-type domain-containing protein n=1 Tax=Kwoniella dendrophila CBS 6074 TaxID=1295534 RepID=A0AAX4JNI2_9TREE
MPPSREPTACLRCRQRKIKCLGPTYSSTSNSNSTETNANADLVPGSCEKCLKAHAKCEFIPHKRGRKVGTRLSEDVKASLKEKYALSQQMKAGNDDDEQRIRRRKRSSISDERYNNMNYSDEYYNIDNNGNQSRKEIYDHVVNYKKSRQKHYNRNDDDQQLHQQIETPYRSTVHQVLPTSSIRLAYDRNYQGQHHEQDEYHSNGRINGDTNNNDYYAIDDYNNPYNNTNNNNSNNNDIGPSASKISSISRLFTIKKSKENITKTTNNYSLFREDPITCSYVDEVTGKKLFDLFMNKLANRVFIFDPILHTYEYVRNTSNFLFCVILAISMKFDQSINRIIHKKCLALAKDQMLRVFADNIESEETVQALYVMTEYKEADDENSYILLGMACRIAVDLDLASPTPDYDERRNRNRQRIWLVIYAADRRYNYCGQTAKPCMMPESSLSRNAAQFIDSPICLIPDFRLAGNVRLRRLLANHIEAIDRDNELHQGSYLLDVGAEYREMEKEADEWTKDQIASEPEMLIHAHLSALHAKVIIAHRWVQRLFRYNEFDNSSRSEENYERERREALSLSDDTLRYACDSKHLYFAYASFFLHKIFDTNIASVMLDKQYISYFINLFDRCAERLEQVTVSSTLTGAFHAAFLRSLSEICNDVLQNNSKVLEERSNSRRSSVGGSSHIPLSNTNPNTSTNAPQITENIDNANDNTITVAQTQDAPVYFNGIFDENTIPPSLSTSYDNIDMGLDNLIGFGNFLLDSTSNTEDLLNTNISWNDWWPFDNQFLSGTTDNLNIGIGNEGQAQGQSDINGDTVQDWQGSIQAS